MVSIEQLSLMINQHLGLLTCTDDAPNCMKWKIFESPLGGRGLVATEDIKTGEVLFIDHPLVYGPRSGTIIQRGVKTVEYI
ncbi:unnamed protein product [Euphydryas editha]|uniref:Uncharacterized protein n=1 Tax=Euphydryas editha TaxID=104508 RepID=A0AAU9V2E6_EUPED|nr:unnamed protein product [Euphydryas editha]CAH2104370.1 unnamed protein product [Euphydryas editha]